ncbi:hypothetical protein FJTKL_15324 [Diaporthe vaccinii]|uniref:F-box domain-containing protein n=1 Tax=Diaporthe vaccinii TaxID=105482 RepID=A0ABR4E565_9PEZI
MSTDVIESNTDSMSPRGVAGHPNRAGKGRQDEKPFLCLSLPAEIRNTIYHELLAWRHSQCEDNRLHEQPAITRVNRQLRAEALPLYYASSVVLRVKLSRQRTGFFSPNASWMISPLVLVARRAPAHCTSLVSFSSTSS